MSSFIGGPIGPPAVGKKVGRGRGLKFRLFGYLYRQDSLIAGVVDTAEKFIAGVVDTAEQCIAGVIDTADKHSFAIISANFRKKSK
jgi:hypothetical protein